MINSRQAGVRSIIGEFMIFWIRFYLCCHYRKERSAQLLLDPETLSYWILVLLTCLR